MKFGMVVLVCVVLCFVFFGGKQKDHPSNSSPYGTIVRVQPKGRLIIKMENGRKVVADLISGFSRWNEGDIVEVQDYPNARLIDAASGHRARVLLGAY